MDPSRRQRTRFYCLPMKRRNITPRKKLLRTKYTASKTISPTHGADSIQDSHPHIVHTRNSGKVHQPREVSPNTAYKFNQSYLLSRANVAPMLSNIGYTYIGPLYLFSYRGGSLSRYAKGAHLPLPPQARSKILAHTRRINVACPVGQRRRASEPR